MNSSIEIVNGKNGFILKVNGLYISANLSASQLPIKAIKCDIGIPYGATEWVCVGRLKQFWSDHRSDIVQSIFNPYMSVWGQLIPINKI
jgi:hypothetical protein